MNSLKKIILLFNIFLLQYSAWSQTKISGYEYWVDDDYVNAVNQSVTEIDQFALSESIDMNNVQTGIHTFNIRFEDNNGKWSTAHSRFFYKAPISASTNAKIIAYEYWMDNDYENAMSQSISETDQLILNETLDFSSLQTGIHLFHIRVKDALGNWSSPHSRFFYKTPIKASSNVKITEYEYWMDNDYENAVNQSIAETDQLVLNEDINYSSVHDGMHLFNIRIKDTQGNWSSSHSRFFYKKPVKSVLSKEVVAYQYWLDDDFLSAVTVDINTTDSYNLIENLDYHALSSGDHEIHFRFLDNTDVWSSLISNTFNSIPTNVTQEILTGIKMYPNPVRDQLFIEQHEENKQIKVRILDLAGQCLIEKPLVQPRMSIDLSHFEKGIYLLLMSDGSENQIIKIIKD